MVETNFKHTEIGLIPHDWEVKTLGEISTLINGRAFCQAELLNNGKYKVLRVGNFFSNDSWYYSDLELDEKLYCEIGDLLYAWSCTYGAYIWKEPKTIFHYHIWKVLPEDVEKKFLFYVLNNDTEKQRKTSQGSTMSHITKGFMENRKFALPPTLAEQERIAGAMSSIDTLIGALNEQIEKKRHIKQGTMQQLLTGKKRLAGFTGEWVEVTFEDVFSTISTRGKQLSTSEYDSYGIYPIVDQGQQVIVGYTNKRNPIKCPQKGAIIFGDHTRCFKYVNENFFVGADGTQVLMTKEDFVTKFIYYLCLMLEIPNTGYNRHFKYLKESIFTIPPTIAEQSAIAAVLSGMDTEIAALEQKRDKYIAIKSGMMQDLLTGKIRLV